jgi:hypothetical protein
MTTFSSADLGLSISQTVNLGVERVERNVGRPRSIMADRIDPLIQAR